MTDPDNENAFVDAVAQIALAFSKNGVKCDDIQYISSQLDGLRDAVCRPGLPVSVHNIEYNSDGKVGDLTEAVVSVATALFSIAHAIDGLSHTIEEKDMRDAFDC